MEYIYIGFMLAVGAVLGGALCIFLLQRRKQVLTFTIRLGIALFWTSLALALLLSVWSELSKSIVTGQRPNIWVLMGLASLIGMSSGWLAQLFERRFSKAACADCGHEQRHHKEQGCVDGCVCSRAVYVRRCKLCVHSEHEGYHRCGVQECNCGLKEPLTGKRIKQGFMQLLIITIASLGLVVLGVLASQLIIPKIDPENQDVAALLVILIPAGLAVTAVALHQARHRRSQ